MNKNGNATGRATILDPKLEGKGFHIPRRNYLNAPTNGEVAIMKQLNPSGQFDNYYHTNVSSSEDEENTKTQCHRKRSHFSIQCQASIPDM